MREQESTVQVHFGLARGLETTYKCNVSVNCSGFLSVINRTVGLLTSFLWLNLHLYKEQLNLKQNPVT